MNGKLARALRRLPEKRTASDEARLLRRVQQQHAQSLLGPKSLVTRKHTPRKATPPTWPRTEDQKAQSRPVLVLGKNRERDAGKREKPKSAVSKRMDRPERAALIDAGSAKIARWFGS